MTALDPFDDHPTGYEAARSLDCFRAFCARVVDGDTYDFILDLGITARVRVRVRLKDFDTAEIFHPRSDAELQHGLKAAQFVKDLLLGRPCLVRTFRTSSGADLVTVGRYVADVSFYDQGKTLDLKQVLADNGFAKRPSYP